MTLISNDTVDQSDDLSHSGNAEVNPYCNIAAYKFVKLEEVELAQLCKRLKRKATAENIKGTILLGTEGINLFLAAEHSAIKEYQSYLAQNPKFQDMEYKYSYSDFIPFKKLHVKIRKEIVTFNQMGIEPEQFTAPYVSPTLLAAWLKENKDITLLDTRNEFEYDIGAFAKAHHLNIKNFREFPDALKNDTSLDKKKPVVTYCTGGIRCEKAAAYLLEQGFQEVYQLQGGILNYFEQCGDAFYQGECFVFDDRIAVDSNLKVTQEQYPNIEKI